MTIWSDGQYGHESHQPDLPEPSGPTRSRRRQRKAAAGLAVCLVATGVGIAIGQATDHGPLTASLEAAAAAPGTTTTTVPNSAPLPQPAWTGPALGGGIGPFGKGMFGPFFGGLGTVTAVTPDSFKVKLRDGSTVTFTTSSSTSYDTIGVKVGRGELSVGETVIVRPPLTKGSPAPTNSSKPRAAGAVTLALPTISGKVVSISGGSAVIEDGQGFWRDVSLSTATVYGKSGTSATVADVKTGGYVLVSGHIASDHQTLDAVAVQLGAFAGPGGPGVGEFFGPGRAFGGFGFRFPGYPGGKNPPMQVFPGPADAPTGNS